MGQAEYKSVIKYYDRTNNTFHLIYRKKAILKVNSKTGKTYAYNPQKKVRIPLPEGFHRKYDPKTKQDINLTAEQKQHNKRQEKLVDIALTRAKADLSRGIYEFDKVEASNERVSDWIDSIADTKQAERTTSGYNVLANHIRKFNDITFQDLDAQYINSWVKEQLKRVKRGEIRQTTVRKYFETLVFLLHEAQREKKIESADRIKDDLMRVEYGEHRVGNYFTLEQLEIIDKSNFIRPIVKNAFLFSCFTGLRFSEMEKLQWKDVRVDGENVSVVIEQRKNKNSQIISLSDDAVHYLGQRLEPEDKVFAGISYKSYNENILKMINLCGIERDSFHSHDARRTCASLILRETDSLTIVQKYLDHKNMSETMKYVANHLGDYYSGLKGNEVMPSIRR